MDMRKVCLYLVIILGFLGGGIAGAVAFREMDYSTLLIPATLTAITAHGYAVRQTGKRRNPTN